MNSVVLASDFHLSPGDPEGIRMFERFCREVAAGADRFYILGDLFNFWVGRGNLEVAGIEPVLSALADLSESGVELTLLHGNRDFLMGAPLARRIGAAIPGEELPVELFGRRYLLLHGDSLCTRDVGYQRSKRWMRCGVLHLASRWLPLPASLWVAGRMRAASRKSVARKPREEMEIVGTAVRERFLEGYEALICGHVHLAGTRDYGTPESPRPVHVLGDWTPGGVYARIDPRGVELLDFP